MSNLASGETFSLVWAIAFEFTNPLPSTKVYRRSPLQTFLRRSEALVDWQRTSMVSNLCPDAWPTEKTSGN